MTQRKCARNASLHIQVIIVNLIPFFIHLVNGQIIPGSLQTIDGYDIENGSSPVCWWGNSNTLENDLSTISAEETPWSNKLVKSFVLKGDVKLLSACPEGSTLKGYAPKELTDEGRVMRTGRVYDYRVEGSVDLEFLNGDTLVSDKGPVIAVQVILCETGKTAFCTPFVHEQANARLAAQNATVPIEIGDSHGNSHVHSPTVFVELDANAIGPQEFEVLVPTKVNNPGSFFAIAGIQLFTASSKDKVDEIDMFSKVDRSSLLPAQYKYDMANALTTRIINYDSPPTILSVSKGIEMTSWALIGISALIIIFLLWQTVKHIDNQIIHLSQGPFLVVFLVSALTATGSALLTNPKNDIYCNLAAPMIDVPLQIMYAILVGRLWRSNAVISPLLMVSLDRQESWDTKFFNYISTLIKPSNFFKKKGDERTSKALRRSISPVQLTKVVFLFIFPQIIMQTLQLTIQPNSMVIEYNEDESTGRHTCQADGYSQRWLELAASFVLFFLIFALLVLAYYCRTLPSLFNETYSIFSATLTSLIVKILSWVVYGVTDQPTISPDVSYLMSVFSTLIMTTSTTLMIMLPKLCRVWKGEKIMISKLISDHRHDSLGDSLPSWEQRTQTSPTLNVLSSNTQEMKDTSVPASNKSSFNGSKTRVTFSSDGATRKVEPIPEGKATTSDIDTNPKRHNLRRRHSAEFEKSSSYTSSTREVTRAWRSISRFGSDLSVTIKEYESPSRRLLLKMIKVQKALENANGKIMAGTRIPHENWECVRESCIELGIAFDQSVEFEWESNDSDVMEAEE